MTAIEFLPTPRAAAVLGISVATLNRHSADGGIFEEGKHWRRRSLHTNGAKIYEIPLCVETMRRLGYQLPQETLDQVKNAA